jgi:arginase
MPDRTYRILGVPLRSGSLYPGMKTMGRPIATFTYWSGCGRQAPRLVDDGNVAIPSYLPHHSDTSYPELAWATDRLGMCR